MEISRRRFIGTAAGASAVAGLGAIGLGARTAGAAPAASGAGDVVGKISVGYQGWFAAKGDGSPMNSWWHWSANMAQPPSPSNTGIVAWPDVREYTKTYQSGYANLGNGQPA